MCPYTLENIFFSRNPRLLVMMPMLLLLLLSTLLLFSACSFPVSFSYRNILAFVYILSMYTFLLLFIGFYVCMFIRQWFFFPSSHIFLLIARTFFLFSLYYALPLLPISIFLPFIYVVFIKPLSW